MGLIDNFFRNKLNDGVEEKNNFYLGKVSSVYGSTFTFQTENMDLIKYRFNDENVFIPGTINYFVLVESDQGVFIGQVYKSEIKNNGSVHSALLNEAVNDIYPQIYVKILGIYNKQNFKLPGLKNVDIEDKVYIAPKQATKLLVKSLELVKEGNGNTRKIIKNFAKVRLNNSSSSMLSMQADNLFDHHLMIVGATNSGKSTTSLSILDRFHSEKGKILIIDPTGEYEDSFDKNKDKFIKVTLGKEVAFNSGSIHNNEWKMIFKPNHNTQEATLFEAIKELKYQRNHTGKDECFDPEGKTIEEIANILDDIDSDNVDFDVSLLSKQIVNSSVQIDKYKKTYVKNGFSLSSNEWLIKRVRNVLNNTSFSDFFDVNKNRKNIFDVIDKKFISSDKSLYINAKSVDVADDFGKMMINIICGHLLDVDKDGIKNRPFVLFIDEVHRYTFSSDENQDNSSLVNIAREGRKLGIFLFLTTQSPKDVPEILLNQIGTLIIHRLTGYKDIETVKNYLNFDMINYLPNLNRGEAIITSLNLLQNLYIKSIPSNRVQKNDTPIL